MDFIMAFKEIILVVDDNEDDYLSIKRYINVNYKTIYDDGSQDIIKLIQNYKPDCILIDYHLQDKKGIELLRKIKLHKNDEINSKPVIIMTGEKNPEIIVNCMKNQATDYIIKDDHSREGLERVISQSIERADLKKQIKGHKKENKRLENLLNHNLKISSIGQLAGGIAHDFNNIIAGVLGVAELLKKPERNLDVQSLSYVDLIIKSSNRTTNLVSKLLRYGRKELSSSSILDINEVIIDTISILGSTITNKKISLLFECKAQDHELMGDKSLIQNTLMNIIINSTQAIQDLGTIKIISNNIYLDEDYCKNSLFNLKTGEYIRIEIKDNGVGIPKENINKIFEPFYTTKEIDKGTGLGLYSVYRTIIDHNGEITLSSEVNVGTTFYITLPIIKNEISSSAPIKDDVINKEIKTESKGVILLVDDEEIIRFTGKEILKYMGYDVFLAVDGQDAIDVFKREHGKIDLVIMDMLMPKLNGKEAFMEMIKIDKNSKVIISSGFLRDNDVKELNSMGLTGYIHKPYQSSELSKLLDDVLNK
jgi:signal transduction histidine kinase